MTPGFPVRTAAELLDATFAAKWAEREGISPAAGQALRRLLERFVASGGPLAVTDDDAAALAELDRHDLVLLREGQVLLAYPFSGVPTAFVTVLADGQERHACCAIDALGMAALLRERVHVRARCHHCGEPLELQVSPRGPVGAEDLMVWVGSREDLRARACDGL